MTATKVKILSSMDAVNKALHHIGKDQKGYGYNFRGIDDVLNALNPLFKEHSIITTRRNVTTERSIRPYTDKYGKAKEHVEVFLQCEYAFKSLMDGSEIVSSGFGEGQDSSGGDKASSMATSNSYKYVIFEMFNIATQEQKDSDQTTAQDNNKSTSGAPGKKTEPKKPNKSTPAKNKDYEALISLVKAKISGGADRASILKFLGVKSPSELKKWNTADLIDALAGLRDF